jgi:hypothetical protein
MSLKRALFWIALGVGPSACGAGPIDLPDPPPDPSWAVGTFSDVSFEGDVTLGLSRLVILDDGRARMDEVHSCGGLGAVVEGKELEWEVENDDAIIIHGLIGFERVRVTRIDCNTIKLDKVGGSPNSLSTLYRGEMCLAKVAGDCPEGSECDSCETAWCDGSPPPACP